jgi:oligoendopeptidase F
VIAWDGFAVMLAAGLLARSRQPDFAERYQRFVVAGGSAPPDELMATHCIDLNDKCNLGRGLYQSV